MKVFITCTGRIENRFLGNFCIASSYVVIFNNVQALQPVASRCVRIFCKDSHLYSHSYLLEGNKIILSALSHTSFSSVKLHLKIFFISSHFNIWNFYPC